MYVCMCIDMYAYEDKEIAWNYTCEGLCKSVYSSTCIITIIIISNPLLEYKLEMGTLVFVCTGKALLIARFTFNPSHLYAINWMKSWTGRDIIVNGLIGIVELNPCWRGSHCTHWERHTCDWTNIRQTTDVVLFTDVNNIQAELTFWAICATY